MHLRKSVITWRFFLEGERCNGHSNGWHSVKNFGNGGGGDTETTEKPRSGWPTAWATHANRKCLDESIRRDRRITVQNVLHLLNIPINIPQGLRIFLGVQTSSARNSMMFVSFSFWSMSLISPSEKKNKSKGICIISGTDSLVAVKKYNLEQMKVLLCDSPL